MISIVCAIAFHQAVLKDIHLSATPLDKALQKIAETFGSPMTVSNLIKDKIVFIEANHVSEAEIRDQLAKSLDASWEMKDSGWHLGQSPKEQAMAKVRRTEIRTKYLNRTVEGRRKSKLTFDSFTPGFAVQQYTSEAKSESFFGIGDAHYGSPEQRLLSRILFKFDLKRIAATEIGERTVFALKPNGMQSALGFSPDQDIQQFRTEHDIFRKATEPLRKPTEGENRQGDEDYDESAMPEEISNVLLTVYGSDAGIYELALYVVPKNSGERYFSVSASTSEAFFSGVDFSGLLAPKKSDFKLSPEAVAYQRFVRRWRNAKSALTPELIKLFSDPVLRDPLSYGRSETLKFEAQKMNKNVIAVMTDNSMMAEDPVFAELMASGKFGDVLDDYMIKDGNWVRFSSDMEGTDCFPRHDLKRIIDNVRTERCFSLDRQGEFAALCPRGRSSSIAESLIGAFVENTQDETGDSDALRTLGMLTGPERNRALSPSGIPFGQLNAKLQRHLFECVYFNQRSNLQVSPNSRIGDESIVRLEPTLIAPDGISNNAIFRIDAESSPLIRSAGKRANDLTMMVSAWGEMKFRFDHPKDFPSDVGLITMDEPLVRATLSTFTFRLMINPNCEWTASLNRIRRDNDTTFTLRQLPAEFKKDFEEGYKRAEAELREQKEQQKKDGGGTNPFDSLI